MNFVEMCSEDSPDSERCSVAVYGVLRKQNLPILFPEYWKLTGVLDQQRALLLAALKLQVFIPEVCVRENVKFTP
jgi:hypothetical protein